VSTWDPKNVFNCEEQDERDDELFHLRKLVITPSALLIFEQQKNSQIMGKLIAWATLHSLDRIRRNISTRPEMLSLIWKRQTDTTIPPWILNVVVTGNRHEKFL